MKLNHKSFKFLTIQIFLLLILITTTAHADYSVGNTFAGMQYTIYLTKIGSTAISFEENMSLMIDLYDGFGLYLPIGNLFIALYWAPNYHDNHDLLLILNGGVVSDFIGGWGLVLPDYQFTGIFLFFGYEE